MSHADAKSDVATTAKLLVVLLAFAWGFNWIAAGKLDLRILTDRTAFEVFACGGLTYMPMPVIPKAENRTIAVAVKGGPVIFHNLDVYEIKSIWSDSADARSK